MKNLNDEMLVEKCMKKDPQAWEEFYRRFSKLVYWAIEDRFRKYNPTFDINDVNDLHQEFFRKMLQTDKLTQVRQKKDISGWVAMVAGNLTLNHIESKSIHEKRTVSLDEDILGEEGLNLKDAIADPAGDPYKEIEDSNLTEVLKGVIDSLPAREKTILNLHYVYEKKYKDIAMIMKMPINTVSTIIKRAKEDIRVLLVEKGIKNF